MKKIKIKKEIEIIDNKIQIQRISDKWKNYIMQNDTFHFDDTQWILDEIAPLMSQEALDRLESRFDDL